MSEDLETRLRVEATRHWDVECPARQLMLEAAETLRELTINGEAIINWWRHANEASGGCSPHEALQGMKDAVYAVHITLHPPSAALTTFRESTEERDERLRRAAQRAQERVDFVTLERATKMRRS